ncbi:MAG: hypothetical protein IJO24_07060 [Clostridia bacterium]|nr:hypothetical protein [Clostridia bacterium]
MGDIRKYKCNNCGYEISFHFGCGYLNCDEYLKNCMFAENKLKQEIASGQYDDLLKAIFCLPESKAFVFDCNETIFQCCICKHISVYNKKEIFSGIINKYTQRITFKQNCPECNSVSYEDVSDKAYIYCPKCKEETMLLSIIGNFD